MFPSWVRLALALGLPAASSLLVGSPVVAALRLSPQCLPEGGVVELRTLGVATHAVLALVVPWVLELTRWSALR